VNTVFIGDSITQGWLEEGRVFWDQSFRHALNLGVAGDRTEHVLYRLIRKADGGKIGHLDDLRLRPRRIVLMIGTNNLFQHDPDQIVQGIKAVRDRLVALEPQAQIILCSVLPTADEERNRKLVIPVNAAIRKLEGVHWFDLYSQMVDAQGLQRKELFKDNAHLSTQGYRVWHDRLIALDAGS
jgi:lysophospholipase L1-like esterase